MENYSNGMRQPSYRNALRTNNFGKRRNSMKMFLMKDFSEENIKQRPTSFPMNTNQQQINTNRSDFYANQSNIQTTTTNDNAYRIIDEPPQKIRFEQISFHFQLN